MRIAGNAGFFFARENYKFGIGVKLLKLTKDSGNEVEYRRALAGQEARKKNIADAWTQYRAVLKQLGERDAQIADEALAAFRKEVAGVGNKGQLAAIDVVRKHLLRYRDTQRITYEGYAKDFEGIR